MEEEYLNLVKEKRRENLRKNLFGGFFDL